MNSKTNNLGITNDGFNSDAPLTSSQLGDPFLFNGGEAVKIMYRGDYYQYKRTIGDVLTLTFCVAMSCVVSVGVAWIFVEYLTGRG